MDSLHYSHNVFNINRSSVSAWLPSLLPWNLCRCVRMEVPIPNTECCYKFFAHSYQTFWSLHSAWLIRKFTWRDLVRRFCQMLTWLMLSYWIVVKHLNLMRLHALLNRCEVNVSPTLHSLALASFSSCCSISRGSVKWRLLPLWFFLPPRPPPPPPPLPEKYWVSWV